MAKYRIIRGKHYENGKKYIAGEEGRDIIDTSYNLLRLNGDHPKFMKFELIDSRGSVKKRPAPSQQPAKTTPQDNETQIDDGLEEMTLKDLKAFAAQEAIELGAATTKKDIIDLIRSETVNA